MVFLKAVNFIKGKWKNEGCFQDSGKDNQKQNIKSSPSYKTLSEKNIMFVSPNKLKKEISQGNLSFYGEKKKDFYMEKKKEELKNEEK